MMTFVASDFSLRRKVQEFLQCSSMKEMKYFFPVTEVSRDPTIPE